MKERALSGVPKSETKEKGKQLLPFGCGKLPVPGVSVFPTHLPSFMESCLSPCAFFSEKDCSREDSNLAECTASQSICSELPGKIKLNSSWDIQTGYDPPAFGWHMYLMHILLAWIGKKFPSILCGDYIPSYPGLWEVAKDMVISPTPLRALQPSWIQRLLFLDHCWC